ncbi:hypothetical protein BCSAG_27930 [Bacillus cereus]
MQFTEVKIEVFIPEEYIETLRDELNKIGACKTGEYAKGKNVKLK